MRRDERAGVEGGGVLRAGAREVDDGVGAEQQQVAVELIRGRNRRQGQASGNAATGAQLRPELSQERSHGRKRGDWGKKQRKGDGLGVEGGVREID